MATVIEAADGTYTKSLRMREAEMWESSSSSSSALLSLSPRLCITDRERLLCLRATAAESFQARGA